MTWAIDPPLAAHVMLREMGLDRQGAESHRISMNVEQAAKQLEALGSPTRLRIYRALVRAGHAGLPVRQLQERVGISAASTLSHHLHRLVLTDLVSQERQAGQPPSGVIARLRSSSKAPRTRSPER